MHGKKETLTFTSSNNNNLKNKEMKTIEEMKNLVAGGNAQELTLALAETMRGKEISTIYFGYAGQDGVDNFTVGEIVSEYEIASKEEMAGYPSRAAYWESYMTPKQLTETKCKLVLLTAEGRNTQIKCYANESVFWCSDSDRHVYFVEQ